MTKVAIAILNWNGEKLLKEFLPEVIKHSSIPNVEIIVIDNASNDDSICILKNNYPSIRVIQLDKNYGFTGGYNRGLKQVQAEYFILLNSDVAPNKGWLDPLINEMDNNNKTAICVPKIKSYRNPEYFEYAGAAGGFIDKYGFIFCQGRIFDHVEKDFGQYDQSKQIMWASGAALMIRSELFGNENGFDEDFFAHMEEIDLCWKLKNKGWDIKYIAQSEVYHLGGATLDYNNPRKVYLNFRNNLYLLTKNLPKNKLAYILFVRMILDGIAGFKFLLSGEINNFSSVIKAHFSFYSKFHLMYKKRKNNLLSYSTALHQEIYDQSIIYNFFIRGKKTFDELNNKR